MWNHRRALLHTWNSGEVIDAGSIFCAEETDDEEATALSVSIGSTERF